MNQIKTRDEKSLSSEYKILENAKFIILPIG